jgi:polyhydroxyalkanoate synthesis regulator phasin
VSAYGRWLLESVFDNDAAAALDEKTKNPVWLELVRRAGGPTLRVGRRMLYVSLQLAARDKRITDQSWRGLDAGRKEILLPLDDDRCLRDAAHHVSKFNLTQTKTREYVGEILAQSGSARQVRISGPVLIGRMRKLRESLDGAAVLRKVRALHAELEKLREVLQAIAREVRGR